MSGTKTTPDERAALRETITTLDAAWEADDPTRPLVTEHATLTLLAHVAAAVPRLLDALDTAEAEAKRLTPPCDGGCSYNDGPAEDCSAHGRRVTEVWGIVAEVAIQRNDALAKVERQRDRLRAREEQVRRLRAEVTRLHALVADLRAEATRAEAAESVIVDILEAERDEGRAEVARLRALWEHERAKWSDALTLERRDRDEARAEVARLRAAHDLIASVAASGLDVRESVATLEALAARPAPVWDEDTVWDEVQGAVARVVAPYTSGPMDPLDVQVTDAVLAVVREHLPVSGESRATVQAEALRDAADWLARMDDGRDTGYNSAGRGIIAHLRARADRLDPKEK